MNSFFQTLAFTYLLYPILGLLLVGLGIFIAKKNALLNNKRLVGYTIGAITLLTLPALLGFLDYGFMPYGYIFLTMLYLLLGSYNIRMISWVYKDDYKYRHEIILTGFILVVSMLFFTLVFNLCNELKIRSVGIHLPASIRHCLGIYPHLPYLYRHSDSRV
ncbi:TssN family type VI secretion system protein [Bacteroides fragilis]|nr:TssN family type VI secretion system protein [Bacteroides fragilis]